MIEDYFVSGFNTKRPTVTNVKGIATTTYTAVLTNISGKLRTLTTTEITQNEKQDEETTHRFYCGIIDIRYKDVITKDNVNYEVKIVNNPLGLGKFMQVDCKKER